ncbi:DUF4920 domain-containing protein [Thalassotalea marina]|uniref:DUF4920 domain-containing protein n=1 Tax=Thalassotalea marina TaxID=1673741 RepID=A0A919BQ81_9GAMM|nr:DUF4920 domain-containing protein [Thalassotalea marina]GHG05355.1 hypothetical protein GCM10017161_38690 [Thalassotalea marina]
MFQKKLLLTLISTSAFMFSNLSFADSVFGSGADKSKLTAISTILSTPENYLDQSVTVQGTIVKVCKKRGCWMELASDKQYKTLRIKVRDGDMVFPMTTMGKTAYATGPLTAIPLDLEQTKRYLAYQAEEQNETFDENSVTQAITVYQLNPVGVTIAD